MTQYVNGGQNPNRLRAVAVQVMYDPQVNDYVRWTTALGMVHEGWVYYKGKPDDNARRIKDKWVATSNYITIEIATKPRPQCDLSRHFFINVFMFVYVVMNQIGMS